MAASDAAAIRRSGAIGPSPQARQNALQKVEGIVAVGFCQLDQAHDGGGTFAGAQASGNLPTLPTDCYRSDTVFDPDLVNRRLTIADVLRERRPAFEAVIDRLGDGRLVGRFQSVPGQPVMELFCMLLADSSSVFRTQLGDFPLDLVERLEFNQPLGLTKFFRFSFSSDGGQLVWLSVSH